MLIFSEHLLYLSLPHDNHRSQISEGDLGFILKSLANSPGGGESLRSDSFHCETSLLGGLENPFHEPDCFFKCLPPEEKRDHFIEDVVCGVAQRILPL